MYVWLAVLSPRALCPIYVVGVPDEHIGCVLAAFGSRRLEEMEAPEVSQEVATFIDRNQFLSALKRFSYIHNDPPPTHRLQACLLSCRVSDLMHPPTL